MITSITTHKTNVINITINSDYFHDYFKEDISNIFVMRTLSSRTQQSEINIYNIYVTKQQRMELLSGHYSADRAEGKVMFAKAINLTLPISTPPLVPGLLPKLQ